MVHVGSTWNESVSYRDAETGRLVRRLTSHGFVNQTPTYHTNSGFTADGEHLALISVRNGVTWLLCADVTRGTLSALWRAPGLGDRSYMHRGMEFVLPGMDGRGVCGNRLCMAPRSRQVVLACERRLLMVSVDSAKVRVLLDDCGEEWIYGAPTVSPDERWAAVTLSSAHPQWLRGEPVTRSYMDYHDHALRVVRVPLDGSGTVEVLFERRPAQSAHCAFSPTDPDCLYFDLDLPPAYWCGSDGRTPRIWLLNLASRWARPLKYFYPGPFQTHQVWLWDGSALAYHGPLPCGGVYLGLTTVSGQTLWEHCLPEARWYGHVAADPVRKALILDGDFGNHLLRWVYYDGASGQPPRTEPICAHATEWSAIPGQYSHPHPLADPTGRWIAFNAARDARSDVYVVDTRSV